MPYLAGVLGGARAPPESGGSQKGQSLISAYQILAITTNTPGFEKLNTGWLCTLGHFGPVFITLVKMMMKNVAS